MSEYSWQDNDSAKSENSNPSNPTPYDDNNPYERMPYGGNPYNPGQERNYKDPGSPGMATAALVLGICSILFICCGGSVVTGAIGIILAILSRGKGVMNTQAKVGLGLCIGGVVLGIFVIIGYLAYTINSGEFQHYMEQYMEEFDGNSIDNYEDFDDLKEYFSDLKINF